VTIPELAAALAERVREKSALESALYRALLDAEAAIKAEYGPAIRAASFAAAEAGSALNEARASAGAASEPLFGRTVARTTRVRDGGTSWNPKYKDVEERGVVEIRTANIDTVTPSYKLPPVGEPVVRLLLKSGQPGKKVAPLYASHWVGDERRGALNGWAPLEAEAPVTVGGE